jgi:hypothetical protein
MQHVWYAHELVGLEQFNSDPRTDENLEVVTSLSALKELLRSRTKSNAGDIDTAFDVPNKLVAEVLAQEPEEAVRTRGDEVAAFAAVELKQEYGNGERLGGNVTEVEREETEEVIPRAIPRTWVPPKKCATAEEMGSATVGDTRAASLRLRATIQRWTINHGAQRVRNLPAAEFCRETFVLGQALEDGFGNNMYKLLTAAGVAVMLNRSLILGKEGLGWLVSLIN